MNILSLLIFGTFGVGVRYVTDLFLKLQAFPVATLLVNVTGCFLAGLFLFHQGLSSNMKTALMVGLCGGLTTFSAYMIQCLQMLREGQFGKAFLYLVLSQGLGLLAAWAGMKVSGN